MVTEIVKISSSLVSWRGTIVVDNTAAGGATLLREGDDHQGDRGVEQQVGDGHPVLQACPVADDEDIEVLDAAAESDENPEDEKAPCLILAPMNRRTEQRMPKKASKTQYLMMGPMQTSLPWQSSSFTNCEYLTTLAMVTMTVMMSSMRPMM